MKKAVMYGAGNIGRGFIGKVFSESGYSVCFIDIMQEIIDAFNKDNCYRVKIVSNEGETVCNVPNVYAVDAKTDRAIEEIANCDIMATSVGVNVLKLIAPTIAKGIVERMRINKGPLDIILAENQLEADVLMRGYIYECLDAEQKNWADKNLGLVEASIGRMVPKLSEEERGGDVLLIAVEEYATLPVDKDAFCGEIPDLVGLVPYSPFGFYIKRKLFIHNMGHALCAYFGHEKNLTYIYEAAESQEIIMAAKDAMMMIANALSKEYGVPISEVEENVDDLLVRFKNKALKDTVARVGADPIRKIRIDDRLVGAALYAIEMGQMPMGIVRGIVSALRFDNADDASAQKLQADLKTQGIEFVVKEYMGLDLDSELAKMIVSEYNKK